jgi:hypothetical protein
MQTVEFIIFLYKSETNVYIMRSTTEQDNKKEEVSFNAHTLPLFSVIQTLNNKERHRDEKMKHNYS